MSTDVEHSFRDTLYTIDKQGHRRWVYPAFLPGKWFTKRAVVAYLLMAFYLAMPWITINGNQGILFNIPERKFFLFGVEFWATDTFFLVLILPSLAISLFFFTAMFGRVWCGWACPETVFLEFLFRPIERLIEGTPAQRLKLDQSPWNFEKISKKALKHGISAASAWVLASTALAYFVGREPLIRMMSDYPWNNPLPFSLTLILMGIMAFQFGWFREQFCTVVCPYARFQAVMMDSDSLVIGYDYTRGEPRGKHKKGQDSSQLGDCIDCGACVRVCPTGIDIRNGLQLECVACTACADACDAIMDHIEKPRGLIRYDTEHSLRGEVTKFLRPRLVVYCAILLTYGALFYHFLAVRIPYDFEVLRASGEAPFSVVSDGKVMNHFMLRISNKSRATRHFQLSGGPEGVQFTAPIREVDVIAGEIKDLPLFVQFDKQALVAGKLPVAVSVVVDDGSKLERKITLIGPS